jgi:hypothetical protein
MIIIFSPLGSKTIIPIPTATQPHKPTITLCDVNQEYINTAVKPVNCQCPAGYSFNTISTSWGPCPRPDMRDCPQTVVKCIK